VAAKDNAGPRREPPSHSTARLDAAVLPLLVDAKRLASAIGKNGRLRLRRIPGIPAGRHPIVVEIWRVTNGRLELGGIDTHTWSARAGRALGDALSVSRRSALGRTLGAMAEKVSALGSKTLGSFNEILVTVPNVVVGGDQRRIASWVLGMYTDSPLSMWGDRLTGFGFGKRLGIIKRSALGGCEVRSLDGRRLMIATLQPRGARRHGSTRPGAAVRRWMTRPLVGQLTPLALARSHFRRLFDGPDVRVQAVAGELFVAEGFLEGFDPVRLTIEASSAGRPYGGFTAECLDVKLSFPIRLQPK
jgi:hypothetical protein